MINILDGKRIFIPKVRELVIRKKKSNRSLNNLISLKLSKHRKMSKSQASLHQIIQVEFNFLSVYIYFFHPSIHGSLFFLPLLLFQGNANECLQKYQTVFVLSCGSIFQYALLFGLPVYRLFLLVYKSYQLRRPVMLIFKPKLVVGILIPTFSNYKESRDFF